jgi:pimeloyl-ACP methyl ester carboxylesterase
VKPPLQLVLSDRGAGKPVLFQHGLCGDARQPADVFPLHAFRCLTVECRGHGGSEAGDLATFGIVTFADEIAAVLDGLAIGPVPIGGISMGAAIALRLAVVRPDLVSALILARPAWVTEPAPANMRPNAEVGNLLAHYDPVTARAGFDASPTAADLATSAPDNLASLRSFFTREPHDVTAALLTRISQDGPGVTRAQAAAIRVPTLVIGHDRDTIHPLATAQELVALMPTARLSVVAPKADDLDRYRTEFRASLNAFLQEHCP